MVECPKRETGAGSSRASKPQLAPG